jgi:hydrogenase expression/formation protein HypC
MCLGVPGRVVEVNGATAIVDFLGVQRTVRLGLVDRPVGPGDYVLNHVGYAIRRIPDADIAETLAMYEQLLREACDDSADADLMGADEPGELETPGRPGFAVDAPNG